MADPAAAGVAAQVPISTAATTAAHLVLVIRTSPRSRRQWQAWLYSAQTGEVQIK